MKKLKLILLFSLIVFIYTFYSIKQEKFITKYNLDEKEIIGYITKINQDSDKVQIELQAREKILIKYYSKVKKNYKLGEYLKIRGKFIIPINNTNFNLFNYRKYLKSKKINLIFNANEILSLKKFKKNYRIKNKIINRINIINNKYLYTFILGDSFYIDSNIKLSYRNNGISHLFAVSGMHITFLSLFLFKLLNKLLKNKYLINIFLFSFLIFYIFLTNFTPSVIRATFLFIFLSLNKLFKLKLNSLIIIILILDFMLLYNPFYIYNIGFILSFMVSTSLIIFGKITNKYNNYFIKILLVSLVSFLISIPIIINNNNEINLISPFINIIFVPLISLIIFPLSLLTFFFPVFNKLLLSLIKIQEDLSIYFNSINLFTITLREINILIMLLYYILIIFLLVKIINKKFKYLILAIFILLCHNNIKKIDGSTNITFLDVRQGDSLLLEFPYNKNILIDTGGSINKKKQLLENSVIIPYFKSVGIKKLDYLILTHGDYDHMGDAINLVNNFKVNNVIFNCGEFNNLEKELISELGKKRIKYYSCIKELNVSNNKLYFLNSDDYGNENDNSIVLYTELNNNKFLFMGDASVKTEKDVMSKYNLKDIDVIKVGHHGSKTSSSKEFIDSINPKYAVISVGKNNRYNHPNNEVLDILYKSKVYRTDIDGSVMFKIKKNKLDVSTCPP